MENNDIRERIKSATKTDSIISSMDISVWWYFIQG